MSSIKDEYRKLYNEAAKTDSRIQLIRVNGNFPPFREIDKNYSESETEKDALNFGEAVAKIFENEENVPDEIINLIEFTVQFQPQQPFMGGPSTPSEASSYFAKAMGALDQAAKSGGSGSTPSGITECKDPIGPGDMSFDDIAGQEETKENIKRSYIYPYKFPDLFPTKSKGIMFYGPPGTGKTLLAKAATAEIPGAAFFAPTPGEMRGKYEGETEKNIARVFECADQIIGEPIKGAKGEKYRVAVVFIDEFDSLAGLRGDDPGMSRSVNALLQAMDGIKSTPNVSVIAATNFPWRIDDAVLRRFSVKIFIDLPNPIAREFLIRSAIAKVYETPEVKERTKRMLKKNPKAKIKKPQIMNREFDSDTQEFTDYWIGDIFDGIKKYGKSLCTKTVLEEREIQESSYIGFSTTTRKEVISKEKFRLVSGALIEKISNRDHTDDITENTIGMAMTKKSQELVQKIKNNEEVDANDIKDEDRDYWFGYSGSDIDKIMDLAIQNAASRALDNAFMLKNIEGSSYFIATRPKDDNAEYTVTEEANKILSTKFNKKFKTLSSEQALQALNYSLCLDDIIEGMKKYPSTIKNRTYVDLLLFEYQGMVPKKKSED